MAMNARSVRRTVVVSLLVALLAAGAQAQRGRRGATSDAEAEAELQSGIASTRLGKFEEAIPHLLAARGRVANDYAVSFNLALCYVATKRFPQATQVLDELRSSSNDTAEVENLLAQAYVGAGRPDDAFAAAERFMHKAAKNEKLYIFLLDACMDAGYDELGLKIVDAGLRELPKSPRLLFERAMFLSELDRFDAARPVFQRVAELAPGTDVAYIASAQRALYDGNANEAMRVAREGIDKGNEHFLLLAIYAEAVLRAGVAPDRSEYADAIAALEHVVGSHPNYASAQIGLGKLYLGQNRVDAAIARLEAARALDPRNPAVFANLATAYRRRGDTAKAEEALTVLAQINQQQVEKIGSAPGERKAGYATHTPRK